MKSEPPLLIDRPSPPLRGDTAQRAAAYAQCSETTGPVRSVTEGEAYHVQYRSLIAAEPRRALAVLLTVGAFVLEIAFVAWLLAPSHWPQQQGPTLPWIASIVMSASLAVVELLRLVNVFTLAAATLIARDPVPVFPDPTLRAAVITTIVPGKEPLAVVRRTLAAARLVRSEGPLDIWLLDEGDDPLVRAMCQELGVNHFSRRGVERWNTASGPFRARTKHGNHNAWVDAHGDDYDAFLTLDPDHAPLPNFAERMLGYLRDPRVAFVVGPQTYGNDRRFITRAAESQQYVFHSIMQRAGNRYGSPMLVGTSNAVRVRALRDIGGFKDSITEDAATSLALHAHRDPVTGHRWRSVYTPDVLAIGEGPASWTDYFSQQHRWARGGVEIVLKTLARTLPRLRPVHALHYCLLLAFYPLTALAWLLGALNAVTYLTTGTGGLVVATQLWIAFYVNAVALQLALFFYNRRHNTSPHEEEGSSGITGMFVSVLCTPVYVAALGQGLARRTSRFVVTPKGESRSPDRVATFARNLGWAGVYGVALVLSVAFGNNHGSMQLWGALNFLICLTPLGIWGVGTALERRRENAGHPHGTPPSTQPAHPTRADAAPQLSAPDFEAA